MLSLGVVRPRMRDMRILLALPLAALAVSGPARSQVEARQAEPADLQAELSVEVADPMLLDIPLSGKGKPLSDPSVSGRTYYGVKQFVCDKARVTKVSVTKKLRGKGWELEVTPTVTTEWPRQDIDLKVAIVSQGKEVQAKIWDDLTVGTEEGAAYKMGAVWASSSKRPTATFRFKEGELEKLFEGAGPVLRIIVDIQE